MSWNPEQIPDAALITAACVALLFSFVFSAGRSALARITRTYLAQHDNDNPRILRMLDSRVTFLGLADLCRVFTDLAATVSITLSVVGSARHWWSAGLISTLVTACAVTIFSLVLPARLAASHPVWALGVAGPLLTGIDTVLRPLRNTIERLRPQSGLTRLEAAEMAADDLKQMVERVSESEQIADDEREMLHSVFELGHTLVREVMVPRTDMVTLPADKSIDKAITLFVRSGFSRIPLVGQSPDDVQGIVYLKDALRFAHRRHERLDMPAKHIARNPVFVPETKLADNLLAQMQAGNYHMALAVDEYGGIAGLVTLEDLIEEIVGEVADEHDSYEMEIEELEEGVYRVPARYPLDDLGDLMGMDIEDDDVDSVGGLLAKVMGKVPIPGSHASFENLEMLAENSEGRRRRVATIVVSKLDKESE